MGWILIIWCSTSFAFGGVKPAIATAEYITANNCEYAGKAITHAPGGQYFSYICTKK